jgi:hypothetical protein
MSEKEKVARPRGVEAPIVGLSWERIMQGIIQKAGGHPAYGLSGPVALLQSHESRVASGILGRLPGEIPGFPGVLNICADCEPRPRRLLCRLSIVVLQQAAEAGV